ncbi:MAG: lysophospholipid acyltransferase family protein [Fimbriimonadaceae bacterium]|nr:lysophospholipid acyltransferase family protein [Fimbriimonadaceae bacterium]
MKKWWRAVRPGLIAWPIWLLASTLCRTLRLTVLGEEKVQPLERAMILSWHGRTLIGAFQTRKRGYYALISLSNDGNMQDRIFRLFGYRTIRGSTGRGGVKALAECIKVLKSGAVISFTPDGPRGPSHEAQMGCIAMAKKSGARLIPIGISAKRRWLARSWDSYMIPKPFSPAVMLYGDPILVPEDADEAGMEEVRQRLEKALTEIESEAERQMGHPPAWPPSESS